jgi:hypothetical protein
MPARPLSNRVRLVAVSARYLLASLSAFSMSLRNFG